MNVKNVILLLVLFLLFNPFVFAESDEQCKYLSTDKLCREFKIVSGACKEVVATNCCPNEICESDMGYVEDYGVCPQDCAPTKLEFQLANIQPEETFYKSETINIQIALTSHKRNVIGGEVYLTLSFLNGGQKIQLFNDGEHGDGTNLDNIYANYITIPNNVQKGKYLLNLEGKFRDITQTEQFDFIIDPTIKIETNLQEKYYLGDKITITGTSKIKQYPISLPIQIQITDSKDEIVHQETTTTDNTGFFQTEYRTSLLDNEGKWTLKITGQDESDNTVEYEQEFKVWSKEAESQIIVSQLQEFEQDFELGQTVGFTVKVTDSTQDPILRAEVKAVTPTGEIIQLTDNGNGVYAGTYNITNKTPPGLVTLKITATKSTDGTAGEGASTVRFRVKEIPIQLTIIEPQNIHFNLGEILKIKVKAVYPDNSLVPHAKVKAKINETELALKEEESSIFSTEYELTEKEEGHTEIKITVEDPNGNTGTINSFIDVSGVTINYILGENFEMIAIGGIMALIILGVIAYFGGRILYSNNLHKRKRVLLGMVEDTQKKYFEYNTISKNDYKESMERFESELKKIESELERLGE